MEESHPLTGQIMSVYLRQNLVLLRHFFAMAKERKKWYLKKDAPDTFILFLREGLNIQEKIENAREIIYLVHIWSISGTYLVHIWSISGYRLKKYSCYIVVRTKRIILRWVLLM
jgi:hypothetical protein